MFMGKTPGLGRRKIFNEIHENLELFEPFASSPLYQRHFVVLFIRYSVLWQYAADQ